MLKATWIIQRTLAAFLLAVFALSITPKLILHKAVANHEDLVFTIIDTDSETVSPWGFNCDCNHLVAESPFADDVISLNIQQTSVYTSFLGSSYVTALKSAFHSTDLRGPPSI